jgi:molecular chaperone GrpE
MTDENTKENNEEEVVDDEFVPEDGEGNTASQKDVVKDLREKLKQALSEKQEYLDKWQRAQADFMNARKRDEEDKKEFVKFAKAGLVEELVPILESFDMARANKTAWEAVDKNWRMGIEYIQTQLMKVLTENGVSEINPINQKFDPVHHEALSYEPVTDEKLDHMIIEVVQKGYTLGGKELKAPKVKVGEFKKSE